MSDMSWADGQGGDVEGKDAGTRRRLGATKYVKYAKENANPEGSFHTGGLFTEGN
ncbi:MAG TPA: hypothetical protein VEC99_12205 [Clostridia bacterium]|nr:hypothetical protein [Clostridia bacterium]